MNKPLLTRLITVTALLSSALPIFAAPMKFSSPVAAECYLNHHFDAGCGYFDQGDWKAAAKQFSLALKALPCSPEGAEAHFYLGVCHFEMEDLEFANMEFNAYLKKSTNPNRFEEAVFYKFCIAEAFRCGARRRIFRLPYCPKWISARSLALTIYDEVIAALPNQDIAAEALYSKGCLLQKLKEYRESVEAFQQIIRRFPKHELAPQAYLKITAVYLEQSRIELQNPDLLALADLTVERFERDFPRDERIAEAKSRVQCIREGYAGGLCDIGRFYERMKKPFAALIYYKSAVEQFPGTSAAAFATRRIECLGEVAAECCVAEPESCTNENAEAEEELDPDLALEE